MEASIIQQSVQHISSETNRAVSTISAKQLTSLPADELRVLEKKYEAPVIGKLTDAEILRGTANCLLSIHVITGWNLPDDKEYVKVLTEQLFNKLKEDFHMLNFQEVEYAFRQNGIGIKDWGKNMNLDLVCGVLNAYCDKRYAISEAERMLKEKPAPQPVWSDADYDNYDRWEIECFYQRCRKGILPHPGFSFPGYWKDIMVKDGLINAADDIAAFLTNRLNSGIPNVYVQE